MSDNVKKRKKLILIGGGGHCKSVLDAAIQMKNFEEIVIVDNSIPIGMDIMGCRVVGNDDVLPELYAKGFLNAFITVGSIKSADRRVNIYKKVRKSGFVFPNIIDPSAIVSRYANLGNGVFIGKHAVVNSGVLIDDMSIINTGAIIEHESRVGKFTHISIGAVVCGNCEIGDYAFIGANATIIQGVKIGMSSVVGAGNVILRSISENTTIVHGGGKREGVTSRYPPDRFSMESVEIMCREWRYAA